LVFIDQACNTLIQKADHRLNSFLFSKPGRRAKKHFKAVSRHESLRNSSTDSQANMSTDGSESAQFAAWMRDYEQAENDLWTAGIPFEGIVPGNPPAMEEVSGLSESARLDWLARLRLLYTYANAVEKCLQEGTWVEDIPEFTFENRTFMRMSTAEEIRLTNDVLASLANQQALADDPTTRAAYWTARYEVGVRRANNTDLPLYVVPDVDKFNGLEEKDKEKWVKWLGQYISVRKEPPRSRTFMKSLRLPPKVDFMLRQLASK
jgi:hypothetical protein